MSNTTSCLVTQVKNVSGAELQVSCWPPHGKTFAIAESVTLYGDLFSTMAAYRKPQRNLASLMTLLTTGKLAIIKSPAPVMYDATLDRNSILDIDNGVIYAKDPCWEDTEYASPV